MKDCVTSSRAPAAIGPYSQAVRSGGWLFLSGQIGLGRDGKVVEGGVGAEAERALLNLAAVLEEAGLSLRDVVKTTIYLADMADFAAVNEVYARHFEAPFPARATVAVAGLPKGVRVEIEAIAAAA